MAKIEKLERLVIHCTATPAEKNITGDDIRRMHLSPVSDGGRGWDQVGYSVLIHLDGTAEHLVEANNGKDPDQWEITNGAKGYNTTSVHIAYAGGVETDGKTPCDTRTPKQREALALMAVIFRSKYPNIKIVGHNELAAKACPSFDVQEWLKELGLHK